MSTNSSPVPHYTPPLSRNLASSDYSLTSTPPLTKSPSPVPLSFTPDRTQNRTLALPIANQVGYEQSPALDPYSNAKMPGGKPPLFKKPDIAPKPIPLTPNTRQEHPEWMSFSEKKRHFEKSNKTKSNLTSSTNTSTISNSEQIHNLQLESVLESYSENKQFSFLSQNELENLREEDAKKLSNFSEEHLRSIMSADEDDDEENDDFDVQPNGAFVQEYNSTHDTVENNENGHKRIFRTAKAEKLYHKKMGFDVESEEYLKMTPTQRLAIEGEKRKEWRQARLKSLEDDPAMTLLNMKNYEHWAQLHDQIDEEEDQ